jgi:hypothetical protein
MVEVVLMQEEGTVYYKQWELYPLFTWELKN